MRHIRSMILGSVFLGSLAIAPALEAATCTGNVTLGEGSAQIVTGVANKSYQGVCFNDAIVDTAAEGANYGNHGEFVSHLTKLLNTWRQAGLITPREAGELTSAAARSHVGKTMGVRLIAFNDFHGKLQSPGPFGVQAGGPGTPIVNQPAGSPTSGGIDVMAAYVAALKAGHPNSVVVSAGDLIG